MSYATVDISAGCAAAILAGHKSVIRQVIPPDGDGGPPPHVGDVVRVREPWAQLADGSIVLQAQHPHAIIPSWQPPRTMPHEASRCCLELLAVRQERLHQIPDAELEAEGALWRSADRPAGETEREGLARWWDSLHRRPGTRWADNPLVWVLHVALAARLPVAEDVTEATGTMATAQRSADRIDPDSPPTSSAAATELRWHLRASWPDMDFNRHMGNAAYLNLCTTVRMMHFANRGVSMADFARLNVGPVVFRDEIDYHREVHLLEPLSVTLELLGSSEDSSHFRLRNQIWKADGVKAATVVSTGGWFDVTSRRLVAPPDAVRRALDAIPRGEPFAVLQSVAKRA